MISHIQEHFVMDYPTLEALWEKAHGSDWTLCTGMRYTHPELGPITLLHDGGGEFAVCVELEGMLTQIESYTMPWFEQDKFLSDIIRQVREVQAGGNPGYMRVPVRSGITTDHHHHCGHCA